MKPIEKLTALLCEGSERVKEDIMELRKWCIVNDTDFWTWRAEIFWEYNSHTFIVIREFEKERPHLERKTDIEDWEIIWNPIKEHHLRMYCDEKYKWLDAISIWQNWDIYQPSTQRVITRLDITKPLYQQEDEVLENIINFLKG